MHNAFDCLANIIIITTIMMWVSCIKICIAYSFSATKLDATHLLTLFYIYHKPKVSKVQNQPLP